MCGRSRQQFGVLLLVLVVALLAVACGGGEEPPASTASTAATGSPGGGSGATEGLEGVQVMPPDGEPIADRTMRTSDDTPQEFVDALAQGTPVVLLFYVPGATDDTAVLDSLDRLEPSFARYEFLLYNYSLPEEYGDLTTLFEVTYPPQLVLIDRAGIVQLVWSGYVDEGTLNQSLVNLGRE